ncbi:hypothetical protein BJV77DRAFT_959334 [Russula vinacea]|nr:hypothetical protein BJV77DRAFT_959334 [Russula vinacea]
MAMVIFNISKIIGAQVFPRKTHLEHFQEDKKKQQVKEEKAHTTAGVRRGKTSTQIPRPPQPPEPALLNTSNLELLATHEKHRVQEFVASQTSWLRDACAQASGAQIRAKPNNPPASPPRLKSPANKPTTQKKSIAKKSGTLNPTRKERARSDTDEEHLARLTERRERKRARREIMNAREDTRGGKENKKDARDEPNDKRKQRIPAGLALMHGFSSASVGKSRLTIEPPPNFGVFNKGRASAKIKVNQSKRTKQRDRFLDTRPAKSPDERLDPQTSSGRNISNEPSSPAKMKKSTGTHLQKKTPIKMKGAVGRCHSAASMQSDSDTANSVTSRIVGMRGAKQTDRHEPMESRSPAQSISWAIERDGLSLPSTTSDVAVASVKSKSETALLDVRAAAWSAIYLRAPRESPGYFHLSRHDHPPRVTSNAHLELEELATIGPWESVSQVARSTLRSQEPGSMHSRYFALPHNGESGFSQPMTHLVNDPLGQPTSIDDERSNNAGDTTIDGPLTTEKLVATTGVKICLPPLLQHYLGTRLSLSLRGAFSRIRLLHST